MINIFNIFVYDDAKIRNRFLYLFGLRTDKPGKIRVNSALRAIFFLRTSASNFNKPLLSKINLETILNLSPGIIFLKI